MFFIQTLESNWPDVADLISSNTILPPAAGAATSSFVELDSGVGLSAPVANTSDANLLEAFPSNAEALLQNVTMGSGDVSANDLLSALGV